MKKILVWAVLLGFSLNVFTPNTAHAAELEGSTFIYNLDEGGRQEFSGVTEDGQWEASYYVTVSGDRLTRAYAPVASATTGSFTKTSLALLTDKKASYELAWKYGLLSTTSYLNAILGSSSISINY